MAYRSLPTMLLLVLCTALAACSNMENRTDYAYQSAHGPGILHVGKIENECVMELNGAISPDLVRAFEQAGEDLASRKCASKWIVLNSLGGNVNASYAVGNIIRDKGFNTRLSRIGGMCASACGMLFIAGVEREARDSMIVGAHLGFHQFSDDGRCLQPADKDYKELFDYASHFLSSEGSAFFVKLVTDTSCRDLQSSISFKRLKDAGIITRESIGN